MVKVYSTRRVVSYEHFDYFPERERSPYINHVLRGLVNELSAGVDLQDVSDITISFEEPYPANHYSVEYRATMVVDERRNLIDQIEMLKAKVRALEWSLLEP